jgi:hypothetical protein
MADTISLASAVTTKVSNVVSFIQNVQSVRSAVSGGTVEQPSGRKFQTAGTNHNGQREGAAF